MEVHNSGRLVQSLLPDPVLWGVVEILRCCHNVQGHAGVCVKRHWYARIGTALEELACQVFGDLLKQEGVAKVADNLYCGADSLEDLLEVWRLVLSALQRCMLESVPMQTSILRWVWHQGTIRANPHHLSRP